MTIHNRRILVGLDKDGRSTVIADAADMALAFPWTGVTIQELWWQASVPASLTDAGARTEVIGLAAPAGGAVVRILSVPPTSPDTAVDLHFDDSTHIMTMIQGTLNVLLETGAVTLQPGDSIVLPASVHDLRNTTDVAAVFVYTSFPLQRHP